MVLSSSTGTRRHFIAIQCSTPFLGRFLTALIQEWHLPLAESPTDADALLCETDDGLTLCGESITAPVHLDFPISPRLLWNHLQGLLYQTPRRHMRLQVELPGFAIIGERSFPVVLDCLSDYGARFNFPYELGPQEHITLNIDRPPFTGPLPSEVIYALERRQGGNSPLWSIGVLFPHQSVQWRSGVHAYIYDTVQLRLRSRLDERCHREAMTFFDPI